MFMHSYFYPIHSAPRNRSGDTVFLISFCFGVLFGCFLAAPFSDLVGREMALALLSSTRSAGECVLWLILPLLAGVLLSFFESRGLLLALPGLLGVPFGYCVFFLLRFLGQDGLRAAILLLGANVAALPGLFWFLSRQFWGESDSRLQDLTLAAAMCLVPGLLVESALTPMLLEFVQTI